jgi:hypothetical protein
MLNHFQKITTIIHTYSCKMLIIFKKYKIFVVIFLVTGQTVQFPHYPNEIS